MAKGWYVIHTYSGYENKIERHLRKLMEQPDFGAVLTDIKIPCENVIEIKDGKKKTVVRKSLPSYMFLEMDLPDRGWKHICSSIRFIDGVTGFLGQLGANKPVPVPVNEMKAILQRTGDLKADKTVIMRVDFSVGENIKIVSGPFDTFSGKVEEIYADKARLRVLVSIFGRFTPVEVDYTQVEKI